MSNATPATVAKAVKPVKSKTVLSPKALRAVKAFSNAKAAIKLAEARKERAEAILREALGDHGIGTTVDGIKVIEVIDSSRSGYDKDVLISRFPEAADAAYTKTEYTYLKTV
jgi:hypothetical protein